MPTTPIYRTYAAGAGIISIVATINGLRRAGKKHFPFVDALPWSIPSESRVNPLSWIDSLTRMEAYLAEAIRSDLKP